MSTSVDDRSGQPDETTIERGNSLNSDIPEWLQEIRENWVDDEIPVHGDSHASSSHEASLEPIFKRREDLGKHSVKTHFPKDRNCETVVVIRIGEPRLELRCHKLPRTLVSTRKKSRRMTF